jgi:hypothetical protein
MTLYVYFKFIVAEHPRALEIIRAMQDKLLGEYAGLRCNLLKRPNADDEGRETWMETYELITSEQVEFLNRLSELALELKLPQPRRNEIFISL